MYRLAIALLFCLALAFGQQAIATVSEADMDAKIVSYTPAVLPELAAKADVHGEVKFKVRVGADGLVQNIQLLSGHPLLIASAMESVKSRVYKPTLVEDKPVEVSTTATIHL